MLEELQLDVLFMGLLNAVCNHPKSSTSLHNLPVHTLTSPFVASHF